MEFTSEQKRAVTLDGDSLTVSAAAGSGKTAVLAARAVHKLCDIKSGCDADRLLILTFTNAAAAEMRRRIAGMLRDELEKSPDSAHIKRQLSLLPAAKICTIHSACLDLIRRNFEQLQLDPQFTVAEEARLELMRTELTDDFVENLYERAETDKSVKSVIDYFARGRDDRALFAALVQGCDFLVNEPYPEDFINFSCADKNGGVFDLLPDSFIYNKILKTLSEILSRYDALISKAQNAGYEKLAAFYDSEREDAAGVLKFAETKDFDRTFKAANGVKFKNHPPRPKDTDEALWNALKDMRTALKNQFAALRDDFLYADEKTILADRKRELEITKSFLALCLELNGILQRERRRLRLVSFDDAEKYALELLIESHDGDSIVKTPLAKELCEFYDEIIVDEFQDCSKIQDCIFRALSKDEKNIFTVGDIKQSIYRFRNAYPQLFIQKQENAVFPDGKTLSAPSKLSLNRNFRSHPKILNFINRVFDTLMTKERSGIDYIGEHRLSDGGLYGESGSASVTLSLITGAGDERQNALSRLKSEAEFVAQKIKSIAGTLKIYDTVSKTERTVTYGDIYVLMRAPATTGSVFEKTLEAAGIGCINNNPSEKYLDTPQVRDVLAYLQAIDNPYNDIPLITLMYSDYYGFSVNELGRIRAENKGVPFFDAVKSYAQKDKKTERFVKILEDLREKSAVTDVYGLINMIYEQSGILLRVLSEPDGESARANLMLLLDFAASFESTRYRGLFSFINYVLKLIEKDQTIPAAKLRKSDGCVNLLSIHRSKGLEFPVVFLVNAGNDILTTVSGDILLNSQLGAGAYIRDEKNHRDFSSLCRNAVRDKIKTDEINEYIRLLYVALTRAESHLFITAAMNAADAEKAIISAADANGTPSDSDIYSKTSFFRWMLYSVIGTKSAAPFCAFAGIDGSSFSGPPRNTCSAGCDSDDELFKAEITAIFNENKDDDITVKAENKNTAFSAEYIKEMTLRRYAFDESTRIPSKLSVSEIKSMKSKGAGANHTPRSACSAGAPKKAVRPRFMQNGITGADRGNATHRFLQFCDFTAVTDKRSLEREILRLKEYEFISKRDCELLEQEKILRFLLSDRMKHLNSLGTCSKEQRFLFTAPANEVLETDSTEPIIIQGVLDCWYIENGKAIIVDYKTDRVKTAAELYDRYSIQLEMYAAALLKLKGLETAHKYIYSFALSEFIEV